MIPVAHLVQAASVAKSDLCYQLYFSFLTTYTLPKAPVMDELRHSFVVHIRKEEPNGAICESFLPELLAEMRPYIESLGPRPGGEDRPLKLPDDSIFLIAETDEGTPQLVGSVALIPTIPGSPQASGLPNDLKIAEIKRVIVRPAYRGKGVAGRLLEAVEDLARRELGVDLLVLETLLLMTSARRLYERNGYHKREIYGRYDASLSQCFEKKL